MNQNNLEKLKEELLELYHLSSAVSVLHWDETVYMPKKGGELRAKTIAEMSGLIHNKFVSPGFGKLIKSAKKDLDEGKLNDNDACIVREVWREYSREKKLPVEFVKELAELESRSEAVWAEARKKTDFKMFLPYLEKIVAMKRREAELVGYEKNPYDALLDLFEPNAKSEEISLIFFELKEFLVPFLQKIKKSKVRINEKVLRGDFPIEKQVEFNKAVAKKIGFDFESGRLDTVIGHPFTIHFHPNDVRITTRYNKKDLLSSVATTIHEAGHALYEQGLSKEHFGTPLSESISLGIHESQSRMWENVVGKSREFWKYFYPRMKKEFPSQFSKTSLEDFHRAINAVKPSLIRVEADEVTYNLHVIMRFEIEKELIDGSIEVKDLPKIWNGKIKEYFGLDVPNDALGVLQDLHWSGGMIGYFPTYTLGNLYSAQFYAKAKEEILNLEKEISLGHFEHLLNWLRKNIHIHGKMFSAEDLVEKVTGEKLSNQYFIEYIKNKYSEIYNLD
jgi:carboxypeptidase Taq